MDYSTILSLAVEILKYAYPFAVIFGLVAKLTNITLSFMFDKKIDM